MKTKINTDRTNTSIINYRSQIHSFIKEYKNNISSPISQRYGEVNKFDNKYNIDCEQDNPININLNDLKNEFNPNIKLKPKVFSFDPNNQNDNDLEIKDSNEDQNLMININDLEIKDSNEDQNLMININDLEIKDSNEDQNLMISPSKSLSKEISPFSSESKTSKNIKLNQNSLNQKTQIADRSKINIQINDNSNDQLKFINKNPEIAKNHFENKKINLKDD
jgi:hypothetical protein